IHVKCMNCHLLAAYRYLYRLSGDEDWRRTVRPSFPGRDPREARYLHRFRLRRLDFEAQIRARRTRRVKLDPHQVQQPDVYLDRYAVQAIDHQVREVGECLKQDDARIAERKIRPSGTCELYSLQRLGEQRVEVTIIQIRDWQGHAAQSPARLTESDTPSV